MPAMPHTTDHVIRSLRNLISMLLGIILLLPLAKKDHRPLAPRQALSPQGVAADVMNEP